MFSVSQVQSTKDKTARSGTVWRNWSGSQSCTPKQVAYPTSIPEVVSIVKRCNQEGRKVRVVGSGHSFTALVPTDDILVSLDKLCGVIEIDAEACTAVVWAGTKLKQLGEELFANGLAQENLGDINVQSIAGAISTGTHGTGIRFGTLATQVLELTAVLGNGEVVTCSHDQHPELFKAMQVSLGALGIIVQVKLQLVPSFRMKYTTGRMKLDECLATLETLRELHRHFEFYCFPYSDTVQVKWMDETDEAPTKHGWKEYVSKMVLENWVFGALSELCRWFPSLCRTVSRLSASSVPVFEEVEYSHRLFATPRLVRFNEMEYNLPVEKMPQVIREVLACIERERFAVHFPIECRFVRGDDIWLSPAHGRDSAYIAVHMYKGMPHDAYFRAMEAIFLRHGGRPHWGKMNFSTSKDFSRMYPKWDAFAALRAEVDPRGILLNPYLEQLLAAQPLATGDVETRTAATSDSEITLSGNGVER